MVRMSARHCRMWTVAGLMALAALAGCRESEQERPLSYSKGTYQGRQDPGLPDATLEALRRRAAGQSFN